MRLREAPSQFLQRHAEALLASRAGVAASYYGACGLLFAVATALHGAFTRQAAALHVLCCACVRQLAVLLLSYCAALHGPSHAWPGQAHALDLALQAMPAV